LTHDPLLPLPHFYFLLVKFFSATKQAPSPLDLKTTQPPTTFTTTTTLVLSASVLWFKFYWGFSTSRKQIYSFFFFNLNTILKCYFFFAYFCSMCILFRCLFVFILFFFKQTCMDLWFVHVMICFRFYKIVFVCKLLKLMSNYRLGVLWWNK
jgi:hypothetical protein